MKLKTKAPVTLEMWIAQVAKFTSGNTNIINTNFPINADEMGVAEICVELKKPLHEGFNATVKYIQHYSITKQELREIVTPEGGDVELQDVTKQYTQEIVSYSKEMSYEDTNNLMIAMDANIPVEVVGLDRLKQTVAKGVLYDAVANNTFGGLIESDYEIITE